jgi:hypothetical protein
MERVPPFGHFFWLECGQERPIAAKERRDAAGERVRHITVDGAFDHANYRGALRPDQERSCP